MSQLGAAHTPAAHLSCTSDSNFPTLALPSTPGKSQPSCHKSRHVPPSLRTLHSSAMPKTGSTITSTTPNCHAQSAPIRKTRVYLNIT